MSRPLRIEYPGAWYHLMNRGRRGDHIFEGNQDRQIFVILLKEAAILWDVHVCAYCLMDNHYHLLVQTPQGNLSRFMRHLNGVYTQRYNRLHKHDGQLFRGRYKSILVAEDSYLLELIRYIHLNPVRAGIVDTPDKFPWSSHSGYISTAKKWDWLYKDFILRMLATGKKKSQLAYCKLMAQSESEDLLSIFERSKWPTFLGDNDFISWVKETFFQKKQNRQVPESVHLAPDQHRIISEVSRIYNVEEQNMLTSRRGRCNEPRDVAIYLCRVLRNDTLSELGKVFGMSGYGPAGNAVNRVRKKMAEDTSLKRQVMYIKKSLSCGENVSR